MKNPAPSVEKTGFFDMINLRKGVTEVIYFTGSEKATISDPYFLFVFANSITGEIVKVMATNVSTTLRYDKFSLIVDNFFSSSTTGFYVYNIYEKASSSDMTVSGNIVESGYMYLKPSTDFEPTEYTEQSNTFKTYNGN